MKFLVAALLLLSCVRSDGGFTGEIVQKILKIAEENGDAIEDLGSNFSEDMVEKIEKLVNENRDKIKNHIEDQEEREKLIHILNKARTNSDKIKSIREETEEIQGRVLEEGNIIPKEESKSIGSTERLLEKGVLEQKEQVPEPVQEITKDEVIERVEEEVKEPCDNGNWSRTGYAPCTPHTVCRGPVQTDGSSTSDVECVKYKEINATGAEAACMPMGGVSIEDCYKHCGFRHNHPDIWPKFFVYGTNKLKNEYCWCVPNRRHLMPNENDEAAKCKDQEISAQYQLSEKITYYEIVNHKGMPKKSIDAGNM